MISEVAVAKLRRLFSGQLVRPTDEDYGRARPLYNAMIDRRPALIARCTRVEDVVACVTVAREHELLVAVRGGGHSIAGKSSCDGGLLIDLSMMKSISVDRVGRTADAGPGFTWGEFDRQTQSAGLATTGGVVTSTGIAGLTLGGGLGWLMPKHGMACDNLLEAEVVTADGSVRTASATGHDDLFWGLRGGGGNFGIVTRFRFRLHPVEQVLAGPVILPVAKARAMFRAWRDWTAQAPEHLMTFPAILPGPDGNPVAAIPVGWSGPIAAGQRYLTELSVLGDAVANFVQPMPYVAMQSMFDHYYPRGWHHYWKSDFLADLSDDAIDTLVDFCARCPTPRTSIVFLEHYHGAARRVAPTATAFAHRTHRYNLVINAMSPDPADSADNIAWARRFWEAMRPYSAGAVYVNYLSEEGDARVQEAYGPNYPRLVELKRKYDPENFFRQNQNVPPARGVAAGAAAATLGGGAAPEKGTRRR